MYIPSGALGTGSWYKKQVEYEWETNFKCNYYIYFQTHDDPKMGTYAIININEGLYCGENIDHIIFKPN